MMSGMFGGGAFVCGAEEGFPVGEAEWADFGMVAESEHAFGPTGLVLEGRFLAEAEFHGFERKGELG